VRTISAETHLAFIRSRESTVGTSFLQTPAWARVKPEWRAESIGWFDSTGTDPVGAGLVLYRQLPRLRRYLAYLPEGPLLDWESDHVGERLSDWLAPMTRHLVAQGSFGVRMGPPVVTRRWTADQVKRGIADPGVRRLDEVPPDSRSSAGARIVSQLRESGWRPPAATGGFAAGQPQYVFQIPLRHADGTARTEAELLAGMNQLWRRNIKKADQCGVVVSTTSPSAATTPRAPGTAEDQVHAFHALYVKTAERDHFTPRPAAYFTTMVSALAAEDPQRITLWFAHHEGDLVAATIAIRVGKHAWYSYGASSSDKREVRASNAIQWAMIRDALTYGADVYDLRGITETLASDDPHLGLIQFKVGTGGEAVEYVGEWDLPLNRVLYAAFGLYLKRRR
jgi:lipid II:glycine glycyltransferase (peptidoglycan interpeptide bridge formation enzyme)